MLTGWATWLGEQLANEEAELEAFESLYDILLGETMHQVNLDEGKGKRLVNDVLKPLAIKRNPTLTSMTQTLILRRLKVKKLAIQVKIFQDQRSSLSREQSRREPEFRMS